MFRCGLYRAIGCILQAVHPAIKQKFYNFSKPIIFVLAFNEHLSIFAALPVKREKGGEVDERLKSVVC